MIKINIALDDQFWKATFEGNTEYEGFGDTPLQAVVALYEAKWNDRLRECEIKSKGKYRVVPLTNS